MGPIYAAWGLFARLEACAHGVRPIYPACDVFTRRVARDNGVQSITKARALLLMRQACVGAAATAWLSLSKIDGCLESVRGFSTAQRAFARREGYYKCVRPFTKAWEWAALARRGAYLHGVMSTHTACGLITRRGAHLHGVRPVTTAWEALPKQALR